MKVFKVVGNVTLSRCHPSYEGARLLATEPAGSSILGLQESPERDLLVVWDERGAGEGSLLAVSDGAEAAQPFRPDLKAVDAYASALLDTVEVDAKTVKNLAGQGQLRK